MEPQRLVALLLLLIPLVASALPSQAALANGGTPTQVVHPTGEFPADVEAVQAAVDLGGIVLLKATNATGVPTAFNFGEPVNLPTPPSRGVFLTLDVEVFGEQVGPHATTINGGYVPFRGVGPKIQSKIQGITFVRPLLAAAIFLQSSGSEIVGNRVVDVQGTFVSTIGLTEGRAVKFLGNADPANAITGDIIVRDNVVTDMHADLSDAFTFDYVAADITIAHNRITSVQSSGILIGDSSGHVTITDNYIAPGPGDPGEFSFGNGMLIAGGSAVEDATFLITRNEIICENPMADGLVFLGYTARGLPNAVITQNTIVIDDSFFGALTFVGDVSGAYVGQNKIRGSGAFAIDLFAFGDPGLTAASNTIVGNDIARFDSQVADLFLDEHTSDTVFVGVNGTVIDLGENNRVTGHMARGQAGIGQQIAEAQALKRAVLFTGSTGPFSD